MVGKGLVEFFALDSNPSLANTRQISTRLSCKHSLKGRPRCQKVLCGTLWLQGDGYGGLPISFRFSFRARPSAQMLATDAYCMLIYIICTASQNNIAYHTCTCTSISTRCAYTVRVVSLFSIHLPAEQTHSYQVGHDFSSQKLFRPQLIRRISEERVKKESSSR